MPGSLRAISEVWAIISRSSDALAQIAFAPDLTVWVDDPFAAVNVGIRLRDAGRLEEAENLYQAVLTTESDYIFALYELGLTLAYQNRFGEAVHYLRRAVSKDPENLNYRICLSSVLGICGETNQAKKLISDYYPRNTSEFNTVKIFLQFVQFASKHSRDSTLVKLREATARGVFASPIQVGEIAYDAIRHQKPFALVRLGDGEGAWSFMNNEDEAEFSELYAANRRSFLIDWFGSDHLLESSEFHEFARQLSSSMGSADIVGLPEMGRVEDEYRILSHRGVPSCVNLLRKFGIFEASKKEISPIFCSANIHYDLFDQGFFDNLWQLGIEVGLITSYKGLNEFFESKGVKVVASHYIPGDSRNFWLEGDGKPLCQFPAHMERVLAEISVEDLQGRLYLVAAGFVGKIYSLEIKRRGGIALDIGSIANIWGRF